RAKLFTINYDTLFEQACRQEAIIVIDGFSFSYPREFDGRNYDYDLVIREGSRIRDEENFVNKVLHLYKMHGSIEWKRYGDLAGC
ncbi:SIR2 family protein, partial [bacterium]|nr:SIR2 family protein [bacterium]